MSLIKRICETCRYHACSSASEPCADCSSRNKWEAAEDLRVSTKALIELEDELEYYKEQAQRITLICNKSYECYKLSERPLCPKICPKNRAIKYTTFHGYCNKCEHETEHEQIRDDSGELIETVTTCLVCGDHDVDVDSKEQFEDEEMYFQMAGDNDMPEGEEENAGDFESTKQSADQSG